MDSSEVGSCRKIRKEDQKTFLKRERSCVDHELGILLLI